MRQLLFTITSTAILLFCSCDQSNQEKAITESTKKGSVAASVPQDDLQNVSQNPSKEFKDVISLLKNDGIKYQIIKPNKEIKILVSAAVNSKFSGLTAAKVYSYLSGDAFEMIDTAINNNPSGDFRYETKNITFNVSNQTMTGGTYSIINKI